jgi:CspA family cold shock protein
MSSSEQQRFTGKVKWFNNKSGFGFVTAMEGDLKDKDIFVHFSSIHVPDDQYKYLVQGEYVEFELTKSDKSGHEFHAVNISGMKGGSLMCETRRQLNDTRPYKPRVYKTPDADSEVTVREGASADVVEQRSDSKKKSSKRPHVKDSEGFTKIPVRRTKTTGK